MSNNRSGPTQVLKYRIDIDGEVSGLKSKIEGIKTSLGDAVDEDKLKKKFKDIDTLFARLKEKISTPPKSTSAFDGVNKDLIKVKQILEEITDELIKNPQKYGDIFKDIIPKDLTERFDKITAAMNTYTEATAKAKEESEKLIAARNDLSKKELEKTKADNNYREKELSYNRVVQSAAGIDSKITSLENLKKAAEDASEGLERLDAIYEANGWNKSKKYTKNGVEYNRPGALAVKKRTEKKYEDAGGDAGLGILETQRADIEKKLKTRQTQLDSATDKLTIATQDASKAKEDYEKELATQNASEIQAITNALLALKDALSQITGVDLTTLGIGDDITEENIQKVKDFVAALQNNYLDEVKTRLQGIVGEMEEVGKETGQTTEKVEEQKKAWVEMSEAEKSFNSFVQRAQQFLGLAGAVEVFRRAIQQAISTVEELDAVMTEMSVVTEGTISDYWDQLPEYAERANELGTSITGAYEAAMIYYQQGLDTNEVIGLSTETLKMARVAGLDAADATDRMTSA